MLACEQQPPLTILAVKTVFIGQSEFCCQVCFCSDFILACLRLSVSQKVLVLALPEHAMTCVQMYAGLMHGLPTARLEDWMTRVWVGQDMHRFPTGHLADCMVPNTKLLACY